MVSVWIWIGVGAGVLLILGLVLFLVLRKKKGRNSKQLPTLPVPEKVDKKDVVKGTAGKVMRGGLSEFEALFKSTANAFSVGDLNSTEEFYEKMSNVYVGLNEMEKKKVAGKALDLHRRISDRIRKEAYGKNG